MIGKPHSRPLEARLLVRPYALVYLYTRRLRVHLVQELLAGLGVAVAVALVFAAIVANGSVAGSAEQIVHAVIGPADLQLHARDSSGMDERLLARVRAMPGVRQAAPLLEQTATLRTAGGRRATVDLAGTDLSFALLNGLAHTLPVAAFSPGGIGISRMSAGELGVGALSGTSIELQLRGKVHTLKVAAVLGPEAAGPLAEARIAVLPLERLQQLAGLPGGLTRILIRTQPGQQARVRAELGKLAGGHLTVARADAEISLLREALRPSDQASGFFAAISALLGFLFAFNAMLLTVPERRQAIADLRLIGTKRAAIIQIVAFQALCLGLFASLLGLAGGYALSRGVFHQSSSYLAEAFTLGSSTVVGLRPLLLALLGGMLATFLASAVPMLDLRRDRALDAVYAADGAPGNTLSARLALRLGLAAAALLVATTILFELQPSLALLASGMLALATVLAIPLVFAAVLRFARAVAERHQRLTVLQVALTSLKATTLRSLALAATGAVAIFGGIALGGSRDDLLRGIDGFAHSYSADAALWVTNPQDNQATVTFEADGYPARIAHVGGVLAVQRFQGGFLELGNRRIWVIARPSGANRNVLASQIVEGSAGRAVGLLGGSGWITISQQIAAERHVRPGGALTLPTPSGDVRFRVAATTTNLAWSPGVIFIGAGDYRRLWHTQAPTALGVTLAPNTSVPAMRNAVAHALGAGSGLEVSTAAAREARIERLTTEGLSRLGEISTLLVIAAILTMAAALGSSVWQRRRALAGLRLSGVRVPRLRRILMLEAALMLGTGCVSGAIAGIYGQVVIDAYLKHITGFPVANLGASGRPLEIMTLVIAAVLAIVAVPGWSAARVSPTLALNE
ncbi:MAG: FtsX-like permease family protein [Solirubrobacterales bacterium]|nr:FtsX-like permease family protein [Solirubrobacterales bacterium]